MNCLRTLRYNFGGDFGNEPYVAIEFNSEGAKLFDQITAANVGKRLAIILDDAVYSAPAIRESFRRKSIDHRWILER